MESEVQASTFKAKCLAILDDVAETRQTVIITKHGRPVAKIIPVDEAPPTMGSVTILAEHDDDLFSTGEDWDADD